MRRDCLHALVVMSMLAVASVTLYTPKKKSPLQMYICKGLDVSLVPRTGLEPVHREVLVFETNASTNSAIWASDCRSYVNMKPPLVSLSVCKVNIFFLIGKII